MPSGFGRRIALPAMALAMAAYFAMHSPLRDPIGDLVGLERPTCYFCSFSLSGIEVPDSLGAIELPDALAAAALLALAAVAGWAVSSLFRGPRYDRLVVFGLVAVALVSVPAAAVGGLASLADGSYLRPPAGPLIAAIPALAVLLGAATRGWRPSLPVIGASPFPTPLVGTLAAGAALLLTAEVIATLLHPPSQGDALSYHAPLGVLFWTDGDLTSPLDRSPETWALAHPGTAELFFGGLRLLGGERVADLGQLPFALLGAAAVYAFTRRTGLRQGSAMLSACAFLLMPMVALQVGAQPNDVAGASLLIGAIALASAPITEWGTARTAAVGLALGLATATKLALIPGVAAIAVFVLGGIVWSRRRTANPLGAAAAVALVLVFLVSVAPWWARNVAREANPVYPQALPVYGHGEDIGGGDQVDFDFVERKAAWPLYPLIEPIDDRSGFGVLLAIAIVPGLLAAARRARLQPLALAGISFAVALPFWWRYTLHEPRFLLAYAGLALALLPWALLAVPRRLRWVAAAFTVLAAAFSVAVTADQQIVPLARQPAARAAFYDHVYGVDPTVQSLPESEGVLQQTGFGHPPIDYASYYPLLGPSQERLVVPLDAAVARESADVVERMSQHGVRYAYVQAIPGFRHEVERLYPPRLFRLVHVSGIVPGERIGVRRTLYRPATSAEAGRAIRRYLFRLESPPRDST